MNKKDSNNNNLRHYDAMRSVPKEALKPISGGRLSGMSNISPTWRIKDMTQVFGPVGFGWKYVIVKQWTEAYGDQVKAFVQVDLYVKENDEWSEPIPGTGGSSMVEKERSGIHVNDEAYKMALTDALSVAMKSLGVAADVYFNNDGDSKYNQYTQPAPPIEEALAALDEAKNNDEYQAVWVKYAVWYGQEGSDFYKKAIETVKRISAQ